MDASTTIVNINPEQLDKLMDFMSGIVGNALEKPANVKAFTALMVKHADALIAGAEESDAEGCFQVLFKDIQLAADPKLATDLVEQVTKVISANTEVKTMLRLRIMANLYNVLSSSSSKNSNTFIVVLLRIIQYGSAVGQMQMLNGYFDLLDDLVIKWSLSVDDARGLFLAVSQALEKEGVQDKAQVFLIKYLATLGGGSTSTPEAIELAAKGAAGAVRNPIVSFLERHNLLGLAAVTALKGTKEHGHLYDLLVIFSSGKLKDYKAFKAKDDAAWMAKYSLDGAACVKQMRLLSLCSLAVEHREIPYSAVAAGLEVPAGEVEKWVVECISASLIEAKMDQLEQRVLITKFTHRVFGPQEWKELALRLESWKTNLKKILGTVSKAQALHARP